MLKRLRGLSVAHAMIFLCIWGSLAVFAYSGARIAADLRQRSDLAKDTLQSQLAGHIGGLTHALQRERGASTGFTASRGENFASALKGLRAASDLTIGQLTSALELVLVDADLESELGARATALLADLAALDATRGDVDALKLTRDEVIARYTQINWDAISILSSIGKSISHSSAARAVQRQAILMRAKDIAGLERAIGSAGFARAQLSDGPFPRELYTRFEALNSQQTALLATYASLASPEIALRLEAATGGPAMQAVDKIRDIVRSFDPARIAEVEPEQWFAAATAMIDDLKVVEDTGAHEIGQEMEIARQAVIDDIVEALIQLVLVMSMLIGLSSVLIRMTNESLRHMVEQVSHLAEGEIDQPISLAAQSDLRAVTVALENYRQGEVGRRAQKTLQTELEESAARGIQRVSSAVSEGDFTHRLRLEGLQGPSLVLGNGINEILEVADGAVKHQRARDKAELERRKNEAAAQSKAMDEMHRVVTATSAGKLDTRMATDGLSGNWLDVASGINLIAERTDTALAHIQKIMGALEAGDLRARLGQAYEGTFQEIANATNASLDHLQSAFSDISGSVASVASVAAELRAGTTDLAERSEVQAQAVFESAAVTKGLGESVAANAVKLTECREMVAGVARKTSKSQDASRRAVASIAAIEAASTKMVKITGTIDEIAFQTNLLALNASVEAARAGDAGKGFGVVASEVRALAGRCGEASQQIAALIGDAVSGVKEGADHVRSTGDLIIEIQSRMAAIERMIETVFSAGEKQTDGVLLLNESIRRVEHAAQSNAALAQENNSLMASLADLEGSLSKALARFEISSDRPAVAGARAQKEMETANPDWAAPADSMSTRASQQGGNGKSDIKQGAKPPEEHADFTDEADPLEASDAETPAHRARAKAS